MPTNLINDITVRSVLTAQKPQGGIPYDYTINPYRGCLFGCSYCYASQFVFDDAGKKADWGHWVEVKRNAVDALQRESHKLTGKSIFFSSATDPYQPIERKLGLTRALLEVLLFAFPAKLRIQTRSPHVTRDIDLFQRFGETVQVGISIPTDSEVVRKAFEPRAPSIPRRLKAATELHNAGITTIASIAPLLPCTPKRLASLLTPCFSRIWVGTMNMHEKDAALRAIYRAYGWEKYLLPTFADEVRFASSVKRINLKMTLRGAIRQSKLSNPGVGYARGLIEKSIIRAIKRITLKKQYVLKGT